MTRRIIAEVFSTDIEAERQTFIYVGDSLNDEPMFSFLPNSVGVSAVTRVLDRIAAPPRWITRGPGGAGFNEMLPPSFTITPTARPSSVATVIVAHGYAQRVQQCNWHHPRYGALLLKAILHKNRTSCSKILGEKGRGQT